MSNSATGTAAIGVTGLAVMGSNIARNFARHGYTVALLTEHGSEGTFVRSETIPEFLAALEKPRRDRQPPGHRRRAQLRVHDLRHSCATLLFTMEVQPVTVQRILRHSSITVTTGTYVEVIEAIQRDALDSMGTCLHTSATVRSTSAVVKIVVKRLRIVCRGPHFPWWS